MAIDIGAGAADSGSTCDPANTWVDTINPANATGTLDTFEIWVSVNATGCKCGTFSGAGTVWLYRDGETIGNVTSGSKQTFTGLSFTVVTGDILGNYVATGYRDFLASVDTHTYYHTGDTMSGMDTYTDVGHYKLSIYATGTESASPSIDVGSGAVTSASGVDPGNTEVDLGNPSNGAGILDSFEVWIRTANGAGLKCGTFSGSGAEWTYRDGATLGDCPAGSKQTFTGLSIDVSISDILGTYCSAGYRCITLTGGAGVYYHVGDTMSGTDTYTLLGANYKMSYYATGAATIFTKDVGGTVTLSGSIAKITLKPIAGTVTIAGSLVKVTLKVLDGGVTLAGTLVKLTQKLFIGVVTIAGSIVKLTSRSIAGSITPSGVLSKLTSKSFAGAVTLVGELARKVTYACSVGGGAVGMAGSLSRITAKNVAGAITPSGILSRLTSKLVGNGGFTASSNYVGSSAIDRTYSTELTIVTWLLLESPATVAETLNVIEIYMKTGGSNIVVGSFYGSDTDWTFRDSVSIGTVTPGSKQTFNTVGFDVQVGDIIGIAGDGEIENDISGSGILVKFGNHMVAEGAQSYMLMSDTTFSLKAYKSTILTGSVSKLTLLGRIMGDGILLPVGSLAKIVLKPISGAVTIAGSLSRFISKGVAGSLTPTGVVTKITSKTAGSGSITPTGSLTKITQKSLSGVVTLAGSLTSGILRILKLFVRARNNRIVTLEHRNYRTITISHKHSQNITLYHRG